MQLSHRLALAFALLTSAAQHARAQAPIRVEPDTDLAHQYAAQYDLDSNLFYTDLETMLDRKHPDAVLLYTTIKDHRKVTEATARHNLSSMVEKPPATTLADALAIITVAANDLRVRYKGEAAEPHMTAPSFPPTAQVQSTTSRPSCANRSLRTATSALSTPTSS